MKSRELIITLLDALNSKEEYVYLQGELAAVGAVLAIQSRSSSTFERRWT
jgi:hypothetical protein